MAFVVLLWRFEQISSSKIRKLAIRKLTCGNCHRGCDAAWVEKGIERFNGEKIDAVFSGI